MQFAWVDAVDTATRRWLDQHTTQLIAAIAGRMPMPEPSAADRADALAELRCVGCGDHTMFRDGAGRALCSTCPKRCAWKGCNAAETAVCCDLHIDASRILVQGYSLAYAEELLGVSLGGER